MSKSTRTRRKNKPAKPYLGFPLFAHATRRWAKKICGRLHYFGPWDDPQAALTKYLEQRDDLHAGRTPRGNSDGLTVRDLVNAFLTSKRHQLDTRQLTSQSFGEYHAACARIVDAFGRECLVTDLRPIDFEQLKFRFPKTWGPLRRGKVIQLIRSVFRYASDQDLIDKSIKFGTEFKRPGKAVLRIHGANTKAQNGGRMFTAEELRKIIDLATMPMKAIIVLTANTGFGNTDCARLPLSALDLARGWVDFPRPKSGIPRRVPLWPETVAALRDAIGNRPTAKSPDDASLVFLTQRGLPWVKVHFHEQEDNKVRLVQNDAISKEMRKLVKQLGIGRPGHGFYAIRHGFQTVGEEARDAAEGIALARDRALCARSSSAAPLHRRQPGHPGRGKLHIGHGVHAAVGFSPMAPSTEASAVSSSGAGLATPLRFPSRPKIPLGVGATSYPAVRARARSSRICFSQTCSRAAMVRRLCPCRLAAATRLILSGRIGVKP